jgi:formylglycine-generating enzyme required for sulfatase activity
MKSCIMISTFFLLLSAASVYAQSAPPPVADLVIHAADNLQDVLLKWSHPLNADSFQVHAGESVDFQVGVATLIGSTTGTTFTHVNGLIGAAKRFYAVVVFSSMVLVPAGPYTMGSQAVGGSATPEHTVNVPAFCIDIYEVTNAEYKAFCDATSRDYPPDPGFSGMPNYFTNAAYVNYPVVTVTWYDAGAYAAWASKRLPTEAEWERAAKGNAENRQWPWGDTWVAGNANVWDNPADGCINTSPVGAYPNGISPAGCYDMAGNVWEWCEDDMHSDYNGAPSNGSAWVNTPRDSERIARGGAWYTIGTHTRCATRYYDYPAGSCSSIGFRCARTP